MKWKGVNETMQKPVSDRRANGMRFGLSALAMITVTACTVTPTPLTQDEVRARIDADRKTMFVDQVPLNGPLTLHDAMARALNYNLEARVHLMEQALAQGQLDLARFEMLPQLALSAGYVGRDNTAASSSQSILTRRQSLEPSTSQDDHRRVADLTMAWNVLDFGVSYVSAQQHGDRALIVEERRRKALHMITQEVRNAYWRAVAAERSLGQIDPLLARVKQAQSDSATIEQMRLRNPMDALVYQRTLLDTVRRLESQRKELLLAKNDLAALINLPPGQEMKLALPDNAYPLPRLALQMNQLEELALSQRPELRESDYQTRITAAETRKAMLRMLPGVEFSVGYNYDSNSYLQNNDWTSFGTRVSWNLLNVASYRSNLRYAKASEEVVKSRRQALSVAVLTQLYVARVNFEDALQQFQSADQLYDIESRIHDQVKAQAGVQRVGELALIQGELNMIQAALQRDLAYAAVRNAYGSVLVTAGGDPLPGETPKDLADVARKLADVEAKWERGEIGVSGG